MPDKAVNGDIYQVVAYAEALGYTEAVLVYSEPLKHPLDMIWGRVRVRRATFVVDGDLEQAGLSFLGEFGLATSDVNVENA